MTALATQRLIVPISPADKQLVERKASARHMSMAEFARRAVLQYEPRDEEEREEEELRALLEVFEQTRARTLEQLDRTDRALDTALAYFETKKKQ